MLRLLRLLVSKALAMASIKGSTKVWSTKAPIEFGRPECNELRFLVLGHAASLVCYRVSAVRCSIDSKPRLLVSLTNLSA